MESQSHGFFFVKYRKTYVFKIMYNIFIFQFDKKLLDFDYGSEEEENTDSDPVNPQTIDAIKVNIDRYLGLIKNGSCSTPHLNIVKTQIFHQWSLKVS